jgi:hypothetical protein
MRIGGSSIFWPAVLLIGIYMTTPAAQHSNTRLASYAMHCRDSKTQDEDEEPLHLINLINLISSVNEASVQRNC